MRKITNRNKIKALATSAALVAVSGGAAFAYWSTTGSGSGSAATSSGNAAVVLHTAFEAGIVPGGTKTVTYTADNSNSSSTQVTLKDPVVSVDTAHAGCSSTWFTATLPNPAGPTTVPASTNGASLGTGTLSFPDRTDNQDACKGATITVSVGSY